MTLLTPTDLAGLGYEADRVAQRIDDIDGPGRRKAIRTMAEVHEALRAAWLAEANGEPLPITHAKLVRTLLDKAERERREDWQ
jgi:hypothetical protein